MDLMTEINAGNGVQRFVIPKELLPMQHEYHITLRVTNFFDESSQLVHVVNKAGGILPKVR